MIKRPSYQYYTTPKERREYLGERYFKINLNDFYCIQVCMHTGEPKRGKGFSIGISVITRMTFLSNYMAMGYAVPCTRKKYDDSFKKVVKLLK